MTSRNSNRWLSFQCILAAIVFGAATTGHAQAPPLVRVRSNTPSIAAVIHVATQRSTAFRHLIATIGATDGLVYVDDGKCGHSVSACLRLSVTVAGPHRLLRILVDLTVRNNDCEIMASIGHELRHAIELLSEPNIRNYQAAWSFFDREAPTDRELGRFETPAAVRTGLAVLAEVCPRQKASSFKREAPTDNNGSATIAAIDAGDAVRPEWRGR